MKLQGYINENLVLVKGAYDDEYQRHCRELECSTGRTESCTAVALCDSLRASDFDDSFVLLCFRGFRFSLARPWDWCVLAAVWPRL